MNGSEIKVLMMHGRPDAHPLHTKFGQSLNADFSFVDFILPWHEKESSRLKRYTSWILCALFLPNKGKYDVILSEGPHFIVGLLKWMTLLSKKQKTIALLDNETLYFIETDFYSERTKKALLSLIRTYDGIISPGKMEADLARKYAKPGTVVEQIFNGINDVRLNSLLKLEPTFATNRIIFIGNVGAGWRSWYKGVDLLLESFELAWKENNALELKFIGEWDVEHFNDLVNKHAPESKHRIELLGFVNDLGEHLKNAKLYLHPARGESWGISVTEAMAAGIMPLVSVDTGSKEVVELVDGSYIMPLNKNEIAKKILSHFKKDVDELTKLSASCKSVAANYSESRSVEAFKDAFKNIVEKLEIKK